MYEIGSLLTTWIKNCILNGGEGEAEEGRSRGRGKSSAALMLSAASAESDFDNNNYDDFYRLTFFSFSSTF